MADPSEDDRAPKRRRVDEASVDTDEASAPLVDSAVVKYESEREHDIVRGNEEGGPAAEVPRVKQAITLSDGTEGHLDPRYYRVIQNILLDLEELDGSSIPIKCPDVTQDLIDFVEDVHSQLGIVNSTDKAEKEWVEGHRDRIFRVFSMCNKEKVYRAIPVVKYLEATVRCACCADACARVWILFLCVCTCTNLASRFFLCAGIHGCIPSVSLSLCRCYRSGHHGTSAQEGGRHSHHQGCV